MNDWRFFVGTYTEPIRFGTGELLASKGEGIGLATLDMRTGVPQILAVCGGVRNPSYLALTADCVYAVNELKAADGKSGGMVSAFRRNANDHLTFLNMQETGGGDPCHVALAPNGKRLYVSNFMSGSVSVHAVSAGGAVQARSQLLQHSGSSIDPVRQAGPHAHSLTLSPDARFALVPDLGLDKLMIYSVDPVEGVLLPSTGQAFFQTQGGSGPRHCTFSADGRFCYLINELASSISVLAYEPQAGTLAPVQTISTLQGPCAGNICADLHITPDGRWLYGSNRGAHTLVAYRVDAATGRLEYTATFSCGGKTPRSFAISPDGAFLLVANQDSDSLVSFRIDAATGRLEKAGECCFGTPVCVKFTGQENTR